MCTVCVCVCNMYGCMYPYLYTEFECGWYATALKAAHWLKNDAHTHSHTHTQHIIAHFIVFTGAGAAAHCNCCHLPGPPACLLSYPVCMRTCVREVHVCVYVYSFRSKLDFSFSFDFTTLICHAERYVRIVVFLVPGVTLSVCVVCVCIRDDVLMCVNVCLSIDLWKNSAQST